MSVLGSSAARDYPSGLRRCGHGLCGWSWRSLESSLGHGCGGSEEISQQLHRLSQQVRHSPVTFSACSLFSVDCRLMMGYVAAVLTYTIILMQFSLDPSTSSEATSTPSICLT